MSAFAGAFGGPDPAAALRRLGFDPAWNEGDLAFAGAVERALSGCDAVVHLAAAVSNAETRTYEPVDAADRESSRPDFSILLYPGHLWDESSPGPSLELSPWVEISAKAPPTLLIHSMNDPTDDVRHSVAYGLALNDVHFRYPGGHPMVYADWLRGEPAQDQWRAHRHDMYKRVRSSTQPRPGIVEAFDSRCTPACRLSAALRNGRPPGPPKPPSTPDDSGRSEEEDVPTERQIELPPSTPPPPNPEPTTEKLEPSSPVTEDEPKE